MQRIVGIIADDLTGATDSAVQFRQTGWTAYLLLTREPPAEVTGQTGLVAIARSLNTRALPEHEAQQVTARAVTEQLQAGIDRLYLKIDSTMRGSVAGQVSGALKAWSHKNPDAIAVICPAYPYMGRVIREGQMFVNDVPLDQSEANRDPVTPVNTSVLTTLVPGAVTIPAAGTAQEMADQIAKTSSDRVVVDASNDEALARLADAIELLGTRAVPVGSAGLARHLARVWRLGDAPMGMPERLDPTQGRIVVGVTSLNAVALDQTEHLCRSFGGQLAHYKIRPAEFSTPERMRENARAMLADSTAPVIVVQPPAARAQTRDREEEARRIARGFGTVIAGLVDSGEVAGLVLVGGDGAEATLAQLKATALRVEGSASEGVPLSRIVGGPAAQLSVTTKAGGFGTTPTLTELISTMLNP